MPLNSQTIVERTVRKMSSMTLAERLQDCGALVDLDGSVALRRRALAEIYSMTTEAPVPVSRVLVELSVCRGTGVESLTSALMAGLFRFDERDSIAPSEWGHVVLGGVGGCLIMRPESDPIVSANGVDQPWPSLATLDVRAAQLREYLQAA